MDKLVFKKQIGQPFSFDTDDKKIIIDGVIEWLNEAKDSGAEFLSFSAYSDSEGHVDEVDIQPFCLVPETDEQFSSRFTKH